MRDTQLFQLALGINSPWIVAASDFDAEKKRLDIEIDFKSGGRFPCPDCKAADCPVHDTTRKTWRHLDFFQHQAFLHASTMYWRGVRVWSMVAASNNSCAVCVARWRR